MAEAAVAAPAPAPSTAPAESAATAPSTGSAEAAVVTTSSGDIPVVPNPRKAAKPIPSRPQLPGVFPDEGDPFPSDQAASPSRGPDGRFLASPSSATSPTAPAGEHSQQLEPKPAKFKFGGEEFDSAEAAEQNFKSLRGQYKPIQQLARQLGGIEKVPETLTRAAESARAWNAEALRLQAELATLRSGQPAGQSPAAPAPDPTPPAEADVDWDLYAEVKKLATESGEPWKAEQWLINETRKLERARFEQMLDARFEPIRVQQQQAEVDGRTTELFSNLQNYTLADGSPAFPELNDGDSAYAIGKMWAQLGLPAEAALTPQGAIAAIAMYRMLASGRSNPQARAAASAPPTQPPPPPPAPTDTQAAAGLVDGRPSLASVAGNGAPSAEAARIVAALRATRTDGRTQMLGFDA